MQTITPELKSLLSQLSHHLQADVQPGNNPPLLEIWDAWIEELNLPPQTKAGHYNYLRGQIAKAGNPLSDATAWFTANNSLAPSTYNRRLWLLNKMSGWAVAEGLLSVNPWLKIKGKRTKKEVIKPFSQAEAVKIIAGFEENYPAWTFFVKFLFLSGCRMSEAIGLLWKHIDFARGEICICESLPLVIGGTGYERARKDTKTGSVRFLTMNAPLTELLGGIKLASADTPEDGLVFTNPTGTNYIDSHNFRDRWIKVLKKAGIPYRRPHIIRHSFASHAIEQGCPLTGVAYLLGHSDTRMVATTYGHLINRPELPSIF
jgi:integrase